jgi:hypothetical protein
MDQPEVNPMTQANKGSEEAGHQDDLTSERLAVKLSPAQRRTILRYAELSAPLADRLSARSAEDTIWTMPTLQ